MNESDAEPAASSEPTAYDEVPYVSTARASTSPVRMEAIARLLGVPAAGANDAFVLEAGCGDGGNLIPLAVALPGSRFVGIDLAASAIATCISVIACAQRWCVCIDASLRAFASCASF